MKKEFTNKEAKELINEFNTYIHYFENNKNINQKYYVSFKKNLDSLTYNNYFINLTKNYISTKKINYDDQLKLFISNVYYYSNSILCLYEFEKLLNNYGNRIIKEIKKLNSCKNNISWFFSSKKRKEEAINAYSNLLEIKNSDFIDQFNKLQTKINLLNQSKAINEICDDFNDHKNDYKKYLILENKNLQNINFKQSVVSNYQIKFNELNVKIQKIEKKINNLTSDIKNSIIRYITQEVTTSLKNIPVEELIKEKKGIRVKLLLDYNITNFFDLYTYSTNQIASIKGISLDNAMTIKTIVRNNVDNLWKSIKIKLTIDDKSKVASDIILSVYKYLHFKDYIDKLKQLQNENNQELTKNFDFFTSLGNCIFIPFYSLEELNTLTSKYNYIVDTINNKYIPLINEMIDLFESLPSPNNDTFDNAWNDFKNNSINYYNVIEEIYPGVLGDDKSLNGLSEELARQIQDQAFFPDGLLCTLRKYQELGVKYILHQEQVLLGDEMGLGKTIEAIATMVSLKNTGATHFLVVCPASVVTNWCREINKHSKLRVTKIYGNSRFKYSAFNSWLKVGDVAVTNFESTSYLKMSNNFKYSLIVIDEAHYIKNPSANRSKNTLELKNHAERSLLMTGTALENKVEEMIQLISYLRPELTKELIQIQYLNTALIFREKIAPVYFRRKREDVLTELPDKIETEEWCELNDTEEEKYESTLYSKNQALIRRVSFNIDDLNYSSKANRLKEIVDDAKADNRKVLVFSFFLDTIFKLHEFLGSCCLNPIYGAISVDRRQEIIDEFEKAEEGKVLLAQITSGGTGLNIQAASVVVICEPQLKPSIENQAISRAYRMGQARKVLVYRLLAANTIDERMLNRLKQKQLLFDNYADKSVAAENQVELDENSLINIIEEEIERINKNKSSNSNVENENYEINDNNLNDLKINEETIIRNPVIPENDEYYNKIMKLDYYELVKFLLEKYGKVNGNYFLDELCQYKNKDIIRGNEGLFCHHIDEDKAIKLSDSTFAINNPYDYQKADRLVYCNYLEHLLLHILIFEKCENYESYGLGGALAYITKGINDIYNGYETKNEYGKKSAELIKDNFDSYIKNLNRLWDDIKLSNRQNSIPKSTLAIGYNNQLYPNILNKIK